MADKKNSEELETEISAQTSETDPDVDVSDDLAADPSDLKPDETAAENSPDTAIDPTDDAPDDSQADDLPDPSEPPADKPAPYSPPVTAAPEPARKSGFGPALLGGVLAAVLGYLVGQGGILNSILPEALRANDHSEAITALQSSHAALSDQLADMSATLDATPAPDLTPITTGLSDLSARLDTADSTLTALAGEIAGLSGLADRLTALEKRPVSEGASPEAVAAYEAELTRLTDTLVAQRADVESMIADAQSLDAASADAARVASAQTAIARMQVRLDTGEPIADILTELSALDVVAPDGLVAAGEGVATLQSLTSDFIPAARAGLSAVREQDAGTRGITGYLKRHLNARSVTPRDGEDPDAVLSRAEAAIVAGDLNGALTELSTLPDAARAPLADWETAATLRVHALSAADDLARSLISN